jgi:lipopolysaccharide/colanic/teichoic acid biosynthesis glycosyltransferase
MKPDPELGVALQRRPPSSQPRPGLLSRAPGQLRPTAVYRLRGKRTFDVVFAILLLVLLAPVLIAIAVAVKLDSRGAVFFRVGRVGFRGQPLLMLKFRKMHSDATGGPLTIEGDPRLTRVGRVLTRARLDELPQLWDVLRGRMSIIGPRPEAPTFVDLHRADYEHILAVRPGITGLAQIAYKEEARIVDASSPIEDYIDRIMPQKLTLDRFYAGDGSFKLDLRIIYWTFVTVMLRHPVSVDRLTGAMSIRRRRPVPSTPPPSATAPPALPQQRGESGQSTAPVSVPPAGGDIASRESTAAMVAPGSSEL